MDVWWNNHFLNKDLESSKLKQPFENGYHLGTRYIYIYIHAPYWGLNPFQFPSKKVLGSPDLFYQAKVEAQDAAARVGKVPGRGFPWDF